MTPSSDSSSSPTRGALRAVQARNTHRAASCATEDVEHLLSSEGFSHQQPQVACSGCSGVHECRHWKDRKSGDNAALIATRIAVEFANASNGLTTASGYWSKSSISPSPERRPPSSLRENEVSVESSHPRFACRQVEVQGHEQKVRDLEDALCRICIQTSPVVI